VAGFSVCNRSATAITFRLAQRLSGNTLSNEMYLFYDTTIAANATGLFTLGVCMSATDVITVQASTANVSFQAWGVESP
jgi:hypothetical protein